MSTPGVTYNVEFRLGGELDWRRASLPMTQTAAAARAQVIQNQMPQTEVRVSQVTNAHALDLRI